MTGISVLQDIHRLLVSNKELTKHVDTKIYPNIALEETTFPFIVLQRDNMVTEYVKDKSIVDTVTVSVNIASTTYQQAVEIAEIVRTVLENRKYGNIFQIRMSDIHEDFVENTYLQTISFEIQINL